MRWGVVSDVHGNLPALDAVLEALDAAGVDGLLCAGDLVGYGPYPDECVARVAASGAVTVAGNHDLIALGRLTTDRCVPLARETLEWTRGRLGGDARAVLEALPLRADLDGGLVMTHGGLGDPQRYVRSEADAREQLEGVAAGGTLVLGHTHVPLVVGEERGELLRDGVGEIALAAGERQLVNPGAVGQSRSADARARAAVLDTDAGTVRLLAVEYDVRATRAALRAAGLPADACHARPQRFRGEWRLRRLLRR